MSEAKTAIKTLNGHPLADTEARKAATARRYGMTEIPVYMPKSAGSGFPFPSAEILDVWDYGLVVHYGTKNIYKLNPATLALEHFFEAGNGSTAKLPNWYCGRILSRYTNAYDYVLMWDANTQKMFRFATNGAETKTFPDQKLGWLRSTGLDREVNHSGETTEGTIIYAEYYLETYGVETDVVKVWRSTDCGATWTSVFEQNCRHSKNPQVYHFHFVRKDPYNDGHWYLGSGDQPSESNIWRSVDDGLTWTKINDPAFSGNLQSMHRTCNLYFTEDYIYWGTDDSVTAYGTSDGGKWCRSPRNLESNQLDIEVLAELGDWVRIAQETPYGVFLATEARSSDRSYCWMVPYDDLTHPVLIARPKGRGYNNQIGQHSYGSRIFHSAWYNLYGEIEHTTRTLVIELSEIGGEID